MAEPEPPDIIIDQPEPEPSRVFAVDSSGTAVKVETAASMGSGIVTLPDATPRPSEGQAAALEPRPRYWTAPDLSPAYADGIEAIAALAWDGTSLTESIEAGRLWNASVLSRRTERECRETSQASPGRRSDDVPVLAGLDAPRTTATAAPASWLVEGSQEGRPEAARTTEREGR